MQKTKFPLLILCLWFGLPLSLALISKLIMLWQTELMVFLLYISFTWSIFLLIFIMETSRRQLFQAQQPVQCSRRLALYGPAAAFLAYLFSPLRGNGDIVAIISILLSSLIYSGLAGLLYGLFMYRGKDTSG